MNWKHIGSTFLATTGFILLLAGGFLLRSAIKYGWSERFTPKQEATSIIKAFAWGILLLVWAAFCW